MNSELLAPGSLHMGGLQAPAPPFVYAGTVGKGHQLALGVASYLIPANIFFQSQR